MFLFKKHCFLNVVTMKKKKNIKTFAHLTQLQLPGLLCKLFIKQQL